MCGAVVCGAVLCRIVLFGAMLFGTVVYENVECWVLVCGAVECVLCGVAWCDMVRLCVHVYVQPLQASSIGCAHFMVWF